MRKSILKAEGAIAVVVVFLALSGWAMPFILNTLIPLFLVYKYWTLFLVCFLASLVFPLPSNTSVVVMSILAANSYLNFPLVLITALIGYVLGDWTGFWLARIFGPKILSWTGFRRIAEYRYFLKAEQYINEHSAITIFLSRFLSAAGPAINILAGLSKISFRKFLTFDLPGEALDVLLFALGGYFFGEQFQNYDSALTVIELVTIAVIIWAYWIFLIYRRKQPKI